MRSTVFGRQKRDKEKDNSRFYTDPESQRGRRVDRRVEFPDNIDSNTFGLHIA